MATRQSHAYSSVLISSQRSSRRASLRIKVASEVFRAAVCGDRNDNLFRAHICGDLRGSNNVQTRRGPSKDTLLLREGASHLPCLTFLDSHSLVIVVSAQMRWHKAYADTFH